MRGYREYIDFNRGDLSVGAWLRPVPPIFKWVCYFGFIPKTQKGRPPNLGLPLIYSIRFN